MISPPISGLNNRSYYRILSHYLIETFASFSMPKADYLSKIKFKKGIESLKTSLKNQNTVYIMASHFGNWEMISGALPLQLSHDVIGVYKPLSNKSIDSYIKRCRARFGLILIPMEKLYRYLRKNTEPKVVVLISDQSPSEEKGGKWVDFLGRETYFYDSITRLSKGQQAQIFYQSVEITDGKYVVDYFRITTESNVHQYSSLLQKDIEKSPNYWLWSHNRWKINERKNKPTTL